MNMSQIQYTEITNRAIIRIGGDDRVLFLQGLLSNDITLLSPENVLYACLLTPQGKFLHDLFLYADGDNILMDCERDRMDDLLRRFRFYKLRSKVTIEAMPDYKIYAAFGSDTPKPDNVIQYVPDPRLPDLGWRIIADHALDLPDAGFEAYDRHRLRLGVPDGSRDLVPEQTTLIEGRIDCLNGVSWTKGCYIGQELTARMHYRGTGKRFLYPVIANDGCILPPAGNDIMVNGTVIGTMHSSNGPYGLATLKVDALPMITDNKGFTVVHLPYFYNNI